MTLTLSTLAIVLGLGLLALALLPSRRRYLQLRESDPVLVTAYTLIALDVALGAQ